MHELLQVEPERVARRADDHLGAHTGRATNIAAGILEMRPGRVVPSGDANLRAGGFGQTLARWRSGKR